MKTARITPSLSTTGTKPKRYTPDPSAETPATLKVSRYRISLGDGTLLYCRIEHHEVLGSGHSSTGVEA